MNQTMSTSSYHLASSKPITARWASESITTAAGVAIFHLATERVVLCYLREEEYWFLPKGRRNPSEEYGKAGEREGWEEVS